jgi:hypothetical protein
MTTASTRSAGPISIASTLRATRQAFLPDGDFEWQATPAGNFAQALCRQNRKGDATTRIGRFSKPASGDLSVTAKAQRFAMGDEKYREKWQNQQQVLSQGYVQPAANSGISIIDPGFLISTVLIRDPRAGHANSEPNV